MHVASVFNLPLTQISAVIYSMSDRAVVGQQFALTRLHCG